MKTILGAGLAGISCSYHIGHEKCTIFEQHSSAGGHIRSHRREGFVWDEGPHVSFTTNSYVRKLFEKSVNGDFLEYEVNVANYYKGNWIPHPAQSNLFAVPEPQRTECLEDFLSIRNTNPYEKNNTFKHYDEWLEHAFGTSFTKYFPAAYTRKYWTCEPSELATDWVGERVFYPDIATVVDGYKQAAEKSTHYIKNIRYPGKGGYDRFSAAMSKGANINCNHRVKSINLADRSIIFTNGVHHQYDELINTIPLPEFVKLAGNHAPQSVQDAAKTLNCSSVLLVNVTAEHIAKKPYHWIYVYDEEKFSTRINHIEMLSPSNAPESKTGIQVEVYESSYKPFNLSHDEIAQAVVLELQEMGLIDQAESVHTNYISYANVIFDSARRDAQNIILSWLESYGLVREDDDLEPMTNWEKAKNFTEGPIALAGRFGQWKYFWTDDCVLRGKQLGSLL